MARIGRGRGRVLQNQTSDSGRLGTVSPVRDVAKADVPRRNPKSNDRQQESRDRFYWDFRGPRGCINEAIQPKFMMPHPETTLGHYLRTCHRSSQKFKVATTELGGRLIGVVGEAWPRSVDLNDVNVTRCATNYANASPFTLVVSNSVGLDCSLIPFFIRKQTKRETMRSPVTVDGTSPTFLVDGLISVNGQMAQIYRMRVLTSAWLVHGQVFRLETGRLQSGVYALNRVTGNYQPR